MDLLIGRDRRRILPAFIDPDPHKPHARHDLAPVLRTTANSDAATAVAAMKAGAKHFIEKLW